MTVAGELGVVGGCPIIHRLLIADCLHGAAFFALPYQKKSVEDFLFRRIKPGLNLHCFRQETGKKKKHIWNFEVLRSGWKKKKIGQAK